MKLPSHVCIGAFDYELIEWTPETAERAGRFGECDNNHKKIRLDRSYGDAQMAVTLIHELIHAIFWVWNADDIVPKGKEEYVAHVVGQGIATILKQNPGLFREIEKAMGR